MISRSSGDFASNVWVDRGRLIFATLDTKNGDVVFAKGVVQCDGDEGSADVRFWRNIFSDLAEPGAPGSKEKPNHYRAQIPECEDDGKITSGEIVGVMESLDQNFGSR